ncbi:hypothetical protein FACS1894195_5020 [Bacteroidia bacterium]|nr:hypothetical protein FACS1894195_5020 [Bacteroidia bacterium]
MLLFIAITTLSCGKVVKQIQNELETVVEGKKLSEENQTFCESYFITIQLKKWLNNDKNAFDFQKIDTDEKFNAVMSLLSAVKSKGYDDVIHAFPIPKEYDSEQRKAYSQSVLQDLGIDPKQSFGDFFAVDMTFYFWCVYSYFNSKLVLPELKATFVEKLDNGNEVWLVQDYQSMKQARLVVKTDGRATIGNLTNLETYINY